MNTDDIKLNLAPGIKLTTLDIVPEFSGYKELMQRAVVILLTSESPAMQVNGFTLPQAVANSTSAGMSELRSYSAQYEDALKSLLNSDSNDVSTVDINIETEGSMARITVNITTYDGEEISGDFTI
jgi:hypothetical protein